MYSGTHYQLRNIWQCWHAGSRSQGRCLTVSNAQDRQETKRIFSVARERPNSLLEVSIDSHKIKLCMFIHQHPLYNALECLLLNMTTMFLIQYAMQLSYLMYRWLHEKNYLTSNTKVLRSEDSALQ
jgi:hypothetical protein